MRFDFVVLGATGMQGKIASRDLLENKYSVLLCGRNKERVLHLLKKYKKTAFEYVDLSNINGTAKIMEKSGANIVVNCVERNWNLNALKACIKANAHSLDLGSEIWMTKKQLGMDKLLKKKALIHITGCGSVPGIGNVMLAYAAREFEKIDEIDVGFAWDSNIKQFVVPFSIQSTIEEFTEPAPLIVNKKTVNVKPLSSVVNCYHKSIRKDKCFHVRHPETYTFYKNFAKKGVKNVRFYAGFPEHSFNAIKLMIDLGFGSKKKIKIDRTEIAPIKFLTEMLKNLETPKEYREWENLWVEITNNKKSVKMECLVQTLKGWEDAGSNIDTGMPASIIAQMIKKETIKEPGSYAPESIVPPEPFFEELRKRKMVILQNGRAIN